MTLSSVTGYLDRAEAQGSGVARVEGSESNIPAETSAGGEESGVRVRKIVEGALGFEHPVVVGSLSNLAELYRTQGKYEQAEPLFKRALDISEKISGPMQQQFIAGSLSNLADIYRAQGKYAQAESLFKRAIAMWEESLGPEHPNLARTLNNMGVLYRAQEKYADAERAFRRALAIREKVLDPQDPEIAQTLANLGRGLRVAGQASRGAAPIQASSGHRAKWVSAGCADGGYEG